MSRPLEAASRSSSASARYTRAPHLQLFLGSPGVRKTTLLHNLRRCIIQELDARPDWLKNSDGFRESLESSMGAPIPFVFELDLYQHVNNQFGSPLMTYLGEKPATLLALLMLLCVARAIDPDISGLTQLVDQLPDQLLAILLPQHVARFVHKHFPRANIDIASTQIYAFEEAGSLGRDVQHCVRAALRNVVLSKKRLPTPIFFTIVTNMRDISLLRHPKG
ncbi:hypothetical protein COCOBI_11-5640 [Coccomyxa sp. Obi]|nr:hypothetical protein COCOBI_11-5640 [Coccomyxa sp. Obi]